MRLLAAVLALITLAACGPDYPQDAKILNESHQLFLLFKNDGCKVYRFMDNGYHHYYTDCAGGVIHTGSHMVGKVRVHDEYEVPTYGARE